MAKEQHHNKGPSSCWTLLNIWHCLLSICGSIMYFGGMCADTRYTSVVILCLLYKIRCNPGTLLMVLYRVCQCRLQAVLWSHIGTLMCHLAAEPRSTAGLITFLVSLWNDLANPVFSGVGLAGFKSSANASYWPRLLYPYYSLLFFPFPFCL